MKEAMQVLKVISPPLRISAASGKKTIAAARNVFPGFIDPRFKKLGLDKTGEIKSTEEVFVCKIKKEKSLREIISSINKIKKFIILEQEQIISFCEKHKRWINPKGWATTFLLKDNDSFFIASVKSRYQKLHIVFCPFEDFFNARDEKQFKKTNHYLVIPNLE